MIELITADTENRGLVLDPRTKLFLMISIVTFCLGGVCSDMRPVRIVTVALGFVPVIMLFTIRKWVRALVSGSLYLLFIMLEYFILPNIHGAWHIPLAIICMFGVRLAPGLIMGGYILQSTTVSEFIGALQRMHVPVQITIPMSVMFRFFPTVTEEFASINTAMKMRDIRFGGVNASKMFEYRIIPLLICSANIGTELSAAALTRGLSPSRKRTNICRIGFHLQDFILFIVGIMPIVAGILTGIGVIS